MAKLIWITNHDEYRYLASEDQRQYADKDATITPADDATLQELAEYCDSEAEGANYHAFASAHVPLAGLIQKYGGYEAAKAVMREIAEAGGLHEWAPLYS